MAIAILHNGEIRPLEPLPADWTEGQKLRVEPVSEDEATPAEIDHDFALLAALCAGNDPADDEQLRHAVQEAHEQAKQQVRKQMGL